MSQNYLEIKNYLFQKDIGEGNFGKVKLGIFKPTGEEFAIKILNKSKIKIKMKNSIFKENEIITRFNHINVVYVFQILEDSQNYYIIMEYCKHGELFDYIVKNEKLSEEEASIFFYQLINGIEYIHSKGISHRDLKPENLLLAENKILKIIDFGLSHEFEGNELLKTKCGSPSYAAPEIICCPYYDGFKVDVWCCGIILYAMLCGYLPFEGEDNNILFQNILNCNPDFPPFLSELSKDIITKILNPVPEKRISINDIKKHSFYLKGKNLCNIDYENIENNIIKRRNIFSKNKIKNITINNKSDTNLNDYNDININNEKYFLTINNNDKSINKNRKKIKLKSPDSNNNNNKNDKNKIKIHNSLKSFKNNSSSKAVKKKNNDINYKYARRIDTITNKIQEILKTDMNVYKNSARPFSSHKNINNINNINNNYSTNINKNIPAQTNNNINNIHNKKELKPTFIDLIVDNKNNNKLKKNSLFIKVLDSTKNKYFNLYNDKYGFINTHNLCINDGQNKKVIKNKDSSSFFNNFKNKIPINNIEIKNDYNSNQIISLSNDNININDIEKYQKTCNNKINQRFNIFKESIKTEKNKNKNNHFIIKKNSSKCENNLDKNINNQNLKSSKSINASNSNNNSKKQNKTKPLNIYVPNSTLYYNNININIKEVNINPKITKNPKTNIISSLTTNQELKSPSQNKKINNNFCSSENKKNIKNKAFSAKRLFSYNINTNNIHNLKSNITNNYNNGNLYTISNNSSNRHFFINTINYDEKNKNNGNKKANKYKNNNNLYGLNKNLRFVCSEKNLKIIKNKRILSTEPKETIKKQFSFNKAITNKNKNNIHIANENNTKYLLNNKKKSKTETTLKSKTINTEGGRNRIKNNTNITNQYNINKKFNCKKGPVHNNLKKKFNNFDEMVFLMFMEQKNNNKNHKINNN